MAGSITETQICNRGMDIIGEKDLLNLDVVSKAGKFCKRNYPILRDAVLEEVRPSFAIERALLSTLSTTPLYGFTFEATLPNDYLSLVGVEDNVDHVIEGRVIQSDSDPLRIQYIKRVENTNFFTMLFVEALAARIAAEAVKKLTNDDKLKKVLADEYAAKRDIARFRLSTETTPQDVSADSEWLNSRQ